MAKLSDRIKLLRSTAGMTQEEFGDKFGIVKSTVSLYENGKSAPNDELKVQICKYFNVSIEFLMGLSNVTSFNTDDFNKGIISDGSCRSRFIDLCEIRKKTVQEVSSGTGIDIDVLDTWFMSEVPNLNQLVLVADYLSTSVDYLLGRTSTYEEISQESCELLSYYNQLSRMDQHFIFGKITELIKESEEREDASVAAEVGNPIRKVSAK